MADPISPGPWRSELRETLLLAVPLAAANLLQMLVYAIDVIFVARLGEESLAAASLATTLFGLMMWCFSGLTGACAPLIAAERVTLPGFLQKHGYRTLCIGKWHLGWEWPGPEPSRMSETRHIR